MTLTLQPAPENFGFKFRRIDLEDKPFIPALVEKVQKVERATTIAEGGVNVHMKRPPGPTLVQLMRNFLSGMMVRIVPSRVS